MILNWMILASTSKFYLLNPKSIQLVQQAFTRLAGTTLLHSVVYLTFCRPTGLEKLWVFLKSYDSEVSLLLRFSDGKVEGRPFSWDRF